MDLVTDNWTLWAGCMPNYLPHYCLNPPTARWGQCLFVTCLYELLGMFEQWLAGWEEASAEPEELPALGLTVPVDTKSTVLLQQHVILYLTTHQLQGREIYSCHGHILQRAANQQSLYPGSGIHLLCNNHSLHVKTMPCLAWEILMTDANLMNKYKLQFSRCLNTSDPGSIFLESHFWCSRSHVFTCPLQWPALLRAWALCVHWLPLTCTPVPFWKMSMLKALCSEVDAVLKCSRSSWYYFSGRNPVLPASASVKSARWSSSGSLPSPLRALQPWGGQSFCLKARSRTHFRGVQGLLWNAHWCEVVLVGKVSMSVSTRPSDFTE